MNKPTDNNDGSFNCAIHSIFNREWNVIDMMKLGIETIEPIGMIIRTWNEEL